MAHCPKALMAGKLQTLLHQWREAVAGGLIQLLKRSLQRVLLLWPVAFLFRLACWVVWQSQIQLANHSCEQLCAHCSVLRGCFFCRRILIFLAHCTPVINKVQHVFQLWIQKIAIEQPVRAKSGWFGPLKRSVSIVPSTVGVDLLILWTIKMTSAATGPSYEPNPPCILVSKEAPDAKALLVVWGRQKIVRVK